MPTLLEHRGIYKQDKLDYNYTNHSNNNRFLSILSKEVVFFIMENSYAILDSMDWPSLDVKRRVILLLDFIEEATREKGFPPSQLDIGEHFNKSQAWASHELARMERLHLIRRRGRMGPEIIIKMISTIPVHESVLLPSGLGDQDKDTLIDLRVLQGQDLENFEYWVYVVHKIPEPDLIEAGLRELDTLVVRKALSGDPGDVVVLQRGQEKLYLGIVPEEEWTDVIVGKVVSIIREEKVPNGKG